MLVQATKVADSLDESLTLFENLECEYGPTRQANLDFM
jgi:hypothetical protein